MLSLQPMNELDYQRFLDYAITNYAEEKFKAGNYAQEDAIQLADQEYKRLLPQGLDTPDHKLLTIVEAEKGQKVGFIWLSLQSTGLLRSLTIVNILIYEPFRRRGYARQTFRLVEQMAREQGIYHLTLQVFGHNDIARSLYESLGYRATNIYMALDIPSELNGDAAQSLQSVHK